MLCVIEIKRRRDGYWFTYHADGEEIGECGPYATKQAAESEGIMDVTTGRTVPSSKYNKPRTYAVQIVRTKREYLNVEVEAHDADHAYKVAMDGVKDGVYTGFTDGQITGHKVKNVQRVTR